MQNIKDKIKEGAIDQAIELWINATDDTGLHKDLIVLSARLSGVQRKLRLGLIDNKEYSLEENRVIYALLELLDQQTLPALESTDSDLVSVRTIAFLEANPFPEYNLFSNVEYREMSFFVKKHAGQFRLSASFGLSLHLFIESINEAQPDIVHVSAFSNLEGIFFHDKNDRPLQVSNEVFVEQLKLIRHSPDCMFFNTFISEEMARTISQKKIYVIGANDLISSEAAIEFATGFYSAIGFGKGYGAAFSIGKKSVVTSLHVSEMDKLFAYDEGEKLQ
jgi:hypothetical protein